MSTASTFLYGGNVHANGIRQHYLRYGGAALTDTGRDAVIIVPGITSPAVTWGFVGERFGTTFDTYVLDVRGRGLSSASGTLDYSLDAQAADLIAFAQVIGLARYSVVGHSMGGRIAVRAARMQPAGLARLVMVDPPVSGPGRRSYPSQLPWYVDSMRLAREGTDAEGMRTFCPTWTHEQRQAARGVAAYMRRACSDRELRGLSHRRYPCGSAAHRCTRDADDRRAWRRGAPGGCRGDPHTGAQARLLRMFPMPVT